ncbi:MAG: hypothetical protein ACE5IY_19260 [bacterium]
MKFKALQMKRRFITGKTVVGIDPGKAATPGRHPGCGEIDAVAVNDSVSSHLESNLLWVLSLAPF